MKKILIVLWLGMVGWLSSLSVAAVEVPDFPACESPTGTIVADYSSGTHGVPGDTSTYTGTDQVYRVDDERLIQCLCIDGDVDGIQTNWWKYGYVDNDQMQVLLDQGWIYIPNGKAWGLNDEPYLAKSRDYICSYGIGGQILGLTSLAGTGSYKVLRELLSGSMAMVAFGVSYLVLEKKWI